MDTIRIKPEDYIKQLLGCMRRVRVPRYVGKQLAHILATKQEYNRFETNKRPKWIIVEDDILESESWLWNYDDYSSSLEAKARREAYNNALNLEKESQATIRDQFFSIMAEKGIIKENAQAMWDNVNNPKFAPIFAAFGIDTSKLGDPVEKVKAARDPKQIAYDKERDNKH